MQIPLQLRQDSKETLQAQLFAQIRTHILEGRLSPGLPMPATRELSEQLSVSRNTVLLAYERLIAEGYLETRPAVGTFVSSHLPEDSLMLTQPVEAGTPAKPSTAPPKRLRFRGRRHRVYNPLDQDLTIDFKVGRPDPDSFPHRAWRKFTLQRLENNGRAMTEYPDPAGLWELRKAIAEHLGPARGIATTADKIVITAGTQEALNIIARLFLGPGSRAVMEHPGYQGAAYLFQSYDAERVPVPVDREGLQVDQLPEQEACVAYLTPSHQYPLGHTLSLQRRLQLLEWAHRQDVYLIEDDYDSDFRHHGSPLTALKGLDRFNHVIYLGTFSKSIGASLRLGYMVLPDNLVEPAIHVKSLLNNSQPWLEQAIVADFIRSGGFANHLRRIRHTYLQRRDCLVSQLNQHFGETHLEGMEGGMHVVWYLPEQLPDAKALETLAFRAGVGIYSLPTGAAFVTDGYTEAKRIVMLGYSSLNERFIREGIARIAASVGVNKRKEANYYAAQYDRGGLQDKSVQ